MRKTGPDWLIPRHVASHSGHLSGSLSVGTPRVLGLLRTVGPVKKSLLGFSRNRFVARFVVGCPSARIVAFAGLY